MKLLELAKKAWDWTMAETPIPLTATSRQVPSDQRIKFFEYLGRTQWNTCDNSKNLKDLFEMCAPLASILTKMAEAFANGQFEVLNARSGNYVRGAYKDWEVLFDTPNPIQSRRQFLKQLYTYTKLNGYCFVIKVVPVGFEVPDQMWILPPWLIEVEKVTKPFYEIDKKTLLQKVYFVHNGQRTLINPEMLMLFTDNTNVFDENTWLPISRVSSMKQPITTLLSSVEAEVTMIQRKGALGILSNRSQDVNGSIALSSQEKQELQSDYRNYGLSRDQWQLIITSANLEYQSMTFPTKDLLLQESYLKAYKDMCEGFGYPFPLTAHSDQSTYENIKTASRLLYQDAIIPEADSLAEQFMRNLNAANNNIKFCFNYEDVPAMQLTDKEKGEGRKAMSDSLINEYKNNIITKNRLLELMGEDTIGDEGDKYYYESPEAQQAFDQQLKMKSNAAGPTA